MFTGKSLKKGIGGITLLFEWSQGHVPLERKLDLSVTSVEQTSLHAWGAKPRLRETRRVAADGRSLKPELFTRVVHGMKELIDSRVPMRAQIKTRVLLSP